MYVNELSKTDIKYIAIHIGLSIVDLGFNAAAGAAAAATGAHVNGNSTTTQIVQYGAIGGAMKSGIINFTQLIALVTNSIYLQVALVIVSGSFGTALLVTQALSQKALQQTPNQLLIAAAAAAAPLMGGTAMIMAPGPVASIQCIGWDALAGYTFARVAQNHGYHVCTFKAAAAAGGVFGSLMFVLNLPKAIYSQRSKSSDSELLDF